ncbi:MAG: calcium/sodium antiporter [Phycisphaerales bacterium]|nr:MAG: calcium/sodium antiporter [Phycisphaerales bacterium]
MTVILFVVGLGGLVSGAEALVRGASRLAASIGVSPLVIGLTVVSFGTSAPELAVSVHAAFVGQADVGLGNIVGSNICNVLLILGAAAAVAPLAIAARLVRFDVWVMISVSVVAFLLSLDGRVGRIDGLLLFAGAVIYTAWLIRENRRRNATASAAGTSTDAQRPSGTRDGWLSSVGLVLLGLLLLVVGARWLVNGAVVFARALGISELIVGLTIVAVGTSLPELATSVVAAARGERDIAVGNVVGSNIFNVLVVLGLSAAVSPHGINVVRTALVFDVPIMVLVAFACLPIFFTGYRVDRWEGFLFLGCYAAYLVYLILDSTRSSALTWYRWGILGFALPLTIYVVAASVAHSLRRRGSVSV